MDSVTEYGEASRSYPTVAQGSEDPTNTLTPWLVARCRQLGVAAERARPAAPTPTCKARQKDRRARWDSNPGHGVLEQCKAWGWPPGASRGRM
jgi:hypothetical protein